MFFFVLRSWITARATLTIACVHGCFQSVSAVSRLVYVPLSYAPGTTLSYMCFWRRYTMSPLSGTTNNSRTHAETTPQCTLHVLLYLLVVVVLSSPPDCTLARSITLLALNARLQTLDYHWMSALQTVLLRCVCGTATTLVYAYVQYDRR